MRGEFGRTKQESGCRASVTSSAECAQLRMIGWMEGLTCLTEIATWDKAALTRKIGTPD